MHSSSGTKNSIAWLTQDIDQVKQKLTAQCQWVSRNLARLAENLLNGGFDQYLAAVSEAGKRPELLARLKSLLEDKQVNTDLKLNMMFALQKKLNNLLLLLKSVTDPHQLSLELCKTRQFAIDLINCLGVKLQPAAKILVVQLIDRGIFLESEINSELVNFLNNDVKPGAKSLTAYGTFSLGYSQKVKPINTETTASETCVLQ